MPPSLLTCTSTGHFSWVQAMLVFDHPTHGKGVCARCSGLQQTFHWMHQVEVPHTLRAWVTQLWHHTKGCFIRVQKSKGE